MYGAASGDIAMIILYSIVYLFFSGCFIAPPTEFVSAGITVQNLFSPWLGSEDFNFIYYHQRRTTLTLLVHSFIPLGSVDCKVTRNEKGITGRAGGFVN